MATSLQVKRGATAKVAAYTPLVGELVLDTTTNKLYSGDGSTVGGNQIVASKKGVSDGSDASTGEVGEYVAASSSSSSITSATVTNLTSISLSAGDWDVDGVAEFLSGAGASASIIRTSISTTSATEGGFGQGQILNATLTAASVNRQTTPTVRLSLTATTTVYLIGYTASSGGTTTARGLIRARRVR